MNKLYFRFIRFSLGIEEGKEFLDGSALKNFDWQAFYEFAGQQTLLGIIMDGVQRLPREVAPKQELFMADYGKATGCRLLMGLGGSLDIFAGVAQRAPEFYCRHNLECSTV